MNKWIESNWFLRIVSVVIAVVLWLIVTQSFPFQSNEKRTIRIHDVNVEAEYNTEQYKLVDLSDSEVSLTLTGQRRELESIPAYRAYVDLSKVQPGQRERVDVKVDGLPENIEVQAQPSTVSVILEEQVHKEMPISIEVQGDLPPGYEIDQATTNADRVLVTGSQDQLDKITKVRALIDVEKETFPLKKWVKLQAMAGNRLATDVNLTPETVQVSVNLKTPSKQLPLSSQIDQEPPEGYQVERIEFDPAEVTVLGPEAVLSTLTSYPPIRLDLSEVVTDETLTIPIENIHDDVQIQPKEVKVKIYIQQE